ncbi:hypothetical protein P3T37_002255 [Kitasatospora sp. MAA4]|uniref:hypothetical protein n=1 Tax=Kitasatospora sp. MAA4 TaxID=3035093 RepID=UPI00247363FF|nr:hypothetical protein [Kitasatospora sp. MAA4]MDH6132869.1 hypothetical protein [Kitasatospora sp. MAA4]
MTEAPYTPTGFSPFRGVPLTVIGEDGEIFLALGHHDDSRMLAAVAAFHRTEYGMRHLPEPGEQPAVARTWALFTQDEFEGENYEWYVTFTGPLTPGAQPVTRVDDDTLGDHQFLARPTRCPRCRRMSGAADTRPHDGGLAFRHRCRTCTTTWPATHRQLLAAASGGGR